MSITIPPQPLLAPLFGSQLEQLCIGGAGALVLLAIVSVFIRYRPKTVVAGEELDDMAILVGASPSPSRTMAGESTPVPRIIPVVLGILAVVLAALSMVFWSSASAQAKDQWRVSTAAELEELSSAPPNQEQLDQVIGCFDGVCGGVLVGDSVLSTQFSEGSVLVKLLGTGAITEDEDGNAVLKLDPSETPAPTGTPGPTDTATPAPTSTPDQTDTPAPTPTEPETSA